jgi:hypothetical protein
MLFCEEGLELIMMQQRRSNPATTKHPQTSSRERKLRFFSLTLPVRTFLAKNVKRQKKRPRLWKKCTSLIESCGGICETESVALVAPHFLCGQGLCVVFSPLFSVLVKNP